jgi:CarboxypepD_reg-like domain
MKKNLQKMAIAAIFSILSVSAWAQTNLKGTISDGKEGLPGVSVVVVGTTKGTLSNADGTYSLQLNKGTYQISFSFIGYASQTQSVTIGDSDVNLDVNLSFGCCCHLNR